MILTSSCRSRPSSTFMSIDVNRVQYASASISELSEEMVRRPAIEPVYSPSTADPNLKRPTETGDPIEYLAKEASKSDILICSPRKRIVLGGWPIFEPSPNLSRTIT